MRKLGLFIVILIALLGLFVNGCTTTTTQPTVQINNHFDVFPGIIIIMFILIGLAVYFLPTIIAMSQHHVNALAIFIVDFLTGWSLVGWVIALVWAVKKKE